MVDDASSPDWGGVSISWELVVLQLWRIIVSLVYHYNLHC